MPEATEQAEEVKAVIIDLTLSDTRYYGAAIVNLKDKTVDLTGVPFSESQQFRYDGEDCCPIKVMLETEALRKAGITEGFQRCSVLAKWAPEEYMVQRADGSYIFASFAMEWRGEYYYKYDGSTCWYRHSDGTNEEFWAPDDYWRSLSYCENCGNFMESEDYNSERGMCNYCAERVVIEEYCQSHRHNNNPVFFGDYQGTFVGMGFELEVDCDKDQEDNNNDVAWGLAGACGLEKNEVRFAYDGSLNHGFECISEPHTVKDFWSKTDKWKAMLKYLSDSGYASHDPGTCGLHVHVSREMFGKSKGAQDSAIAKVYAFFDSNWDDICRISLRSSFVYCNKNRLTYETSMDSKCDTPHKKWKKDISYQRGHGVALNNSNNHTFEYRLGRGTLNPWSFFAWIDFVLTITKNAKRITIGKVNSNDLLSWLSGVTESTARYIYKRGAFRKQMLELYPAISWETDFTDCQ